MKYSLSGHSGSAPVVMPVLDVPFVAGSEPLLVPSEAVVPVSLVVVLGLVELMLVDPFALASPSPLSVDPSALDVASLPSATGSLSSFGVQCTNASAKHDRIV